jgi:hypothetical protein
MPSIRKRKIWWEPAPGATRYMVYACKDETLFGPGNFNWIATPGIAFREVAGKTELIIPDEWPEFPQEEGTYSIAITSRDEVGNESDPFLSSGLFKFYAPPPPARGGVEVL